MWSVLITLVILFVGHYETHAGVTVLHAKEPTKLHLNESRPISIANGTNNQTDTILLTRDRKLEDLWRTENGLLVKLVPVDEASLEIARKIELLNNTPAFSEEPNLMETTPKEKRSSQSGNSSPSNRQKRTFWPFTSWFGYDYYAPPPPIYGPGVLGPMGPMSPFGGFGPGMGMGMGVGYLPPPPPFFGLELALGR